MQNLKLKNLLLFFVIILSINLNAQSLSQFRQGDSIIAGIGCSQGFSKEYSFKPQDINSYKHLGEHFGKDKFQVYFKGKPLPNINPAKADLIFAKDSISNEISSYKFLSDGKVTYFDDVMLQNSDAKNIFYLTDYRIPLFRSNNNVYFKGYLLDQLNVDKTSVIDSHPNENINFFTDGKYVYKNEILIENADALSFKRNGYVAKNLMNGKYEDVADSRDNKNFYNNGKKIKIYPNFNETKLFPDSIYTKQHTVVFISQYETQDIEAKPAIDFYLSDTDFKQLTKNIILNRKTDLFLETEPFLDQVKGYKIEVYKNKNLETTYYYEQDLEEWDILNVTQINIVGDGFHFAKKDFDLLRQKGKPLKYLKETFDDLKKWHQKITELKNSDKVIYYEPFSYYFSPVDKEGKQYKRTIYEYSYGNNDENRTQLSFYEGLFTFKMERNKSAEMMGGDIGSFDNEERQMKKIQLTESILGKGDYFIHTNYEIDYINDEQWLTFEIYCSKELMQKVSKEYIKNNWQKIIHEINWLEK